MHAREILTTLRPEAVSLPSEHFACRRAERSWAKFLAFSAEYNDRPRVRSGELQVGSDVTQVVRSDYITKVPVGVLPCGVTSSLSIAPIPGMIVYKGEMVRPLLTYPQDREHVDEITSVFERLNLKTTGKEWYPRGIASLLTRLGYAVDIPLFMELTAGFEKMARLARWRTRTDVFWRMVFTPRLPVPNRSGSPGFPRSPR